jgi:putative transposase
MKATFDTTNIVFFKLHVHWVFVAKYLHRVFDAQAIDLLRGIFADVCSDAHATRVQMDGKDGHVHLLAQYLPKVAVSSLVNSLKGVSSRLLRQQRPDICKRYWKGVIWSSSRPIHGPTAPGRIRAGQRGDVARPRKRPVMKDLVLFETPAGRLATAFTGDSIGTNILMLGYAAQKGLLPLSLDSIQEAIRLNGTFVDGNLRRGIRSGSPTTVLRRLNPAVRVTPGNGRQPPHVLRPLRDVAARSARSVYQPAQRFASRAVLAERSGSSFPSPRIAASAWARA